MITDLGPGMIATPDARATAVGQDVLDRGGSAADAVVAASAMLCVVYPQNVTLGGDTWTLVGSAGTVPVAVNGTGRAPAALSAERLRQLGFDTVPGAGPHAITVPGLVSAWGELHRGWGRLPFAELIMPARAAADDGFAVAPALARDLAQHADALCRDRGCADSLLRPDGTPPGLGDQIRLPRLAETLGLIAGGGPEVMYTGDVGRRYAAGLAAAGSTITAADLAAHRTERAAPLSLDLGGLEIVTAPPNSQGFTLLLILALAAELGLDDLADPEQVGTAVIIAELAGRVRDRQLADADAMLTDPQSLLAGRQLAGLVQEVRHRATIGGEPAVGPRPPLGGDTIGIVARDPDGLWVSSVQSVAGTFGSRVLEPSTASWHTTGAAGSASNLIIPAGWSVAAGRRTR